MRKFLLIAAAGLILAGCYEKGPRIALEPENLDLGEVVNGQIVVREVTVFNRGEAPLHVEAISTSCGCTTAGLDPMTIPAGMSGVLTIEFDSGAHGPDLTGELLRQVFIASNDADRSELVLNIEAVILPGPDS